MTFLNPTFLWALLGLAVPLAIHLWSKKEGRTVRVGSIRFFRESDPKKTSSIKLNEFWLLLLRMLIITVLVLIIAEPRVERNSENTGLTYIVEPSLLSYEKVDSLLDTLPENVQVKLLQKEFPDFDKEDFQQNNFSTPDYWQLSTQMEEIPTDSIIVLTNAFVSGIKGKRPKTGKHVNWVHLDPGQPQRELVQAISKDNEVELTWIESDNKILKFEKEFLSDKSESISFNTGKDSVTYSDEGKKIQAALDPADTISVSIVKNANFEQEVMFLKASYAAIGNYLGMPLNLRVINEEDFTLMDSDQTVVWLSDLPPPATNGKILIFKHDSLANQLIAKGNSDREFYLTSPLNSENIIEDDLTEKLLLLLDLNMKIENLIPRYDRRIMDLEEMQPVYSAGISEKSLSGTNDISKYLWLVLLVLLLAERWLAYNKKQ